MENNEFGFYPGFDPDDGVSPELDALIVSLGWMHRAVDTLPAILNQEEIQRLRLTYELVKHITKDIEGVEVSYAMHTPYKSSGHVSVVAKRLEFLRPDRFMKVIELVGNMDLYTKTDGTVCLDFSFNKLMTTIHEKERR